MMENAAANCDDSPNDTLCCAVDMMCVRHRSLLLDAFVFVEHLERVGCKLAGSVVSHKLDLLTELRLYHGDVLPDVVFTLGLHLQTEALHTPTGFVHDQ